MTLPSQRVISTGSASRGGVPSVHCRAPRRIDQHQVGRFSRGQRTSLRGSLADSRGRVAHAVGDLLPGQTARGDHGLHHHAESLLQPQHAGPGVHEGVVLVLGCVGSVVRGDRVDGAIGQGLPYRLHMLAGAQRGIHLEGGVVADHLGSGQVQVVRRGLGGDPDPAPLRPAQHLHALGGRDVAHVQTGAGGLRQGDVAGDDHRLRDWRPAGQSQPS